MIFEPTNPHEPLLLLAIAQLLQILARNNMTDSTDLPEASDGLDRWGGQPLDRHAVDVTQDSR